MTHIIGFFHEKTKMSMSPPRLIGGSQKRLQATSRYFEYLSVPR